MPEIPTLAEVLINHWLNDDHCSCGQGFKSWIEDEWSEHVAEAYREARTIRTEEQLREVGRFVGATVRDAGRYVLEKLDSSDYGWHETGEWHPHRPQLPALVVWTLRDEASNG